MHIDNKFAYCNCRKQIQKYVYVCEVKSSFETYNIPEHRVQTNDPIVILT